MKADEVPTAIVTPLKQGHGGEGEFIRQKISVGDYLLLSSQIQRAQWLRARRLVRRRVFRDAKAAAEIRTRDLLITSETLYH